MLARQRVLLLAAAIAAPLLAGFAALALAQAGTKDAPSLERLQQRTQRLAEQSRPRTAVPFDSSQFEKYIGTYQRAPYEFFTIKRQEEHFILGLEAAGVDKPVDLEVYPEGATKFFVKTKPIQISFSPDAQGKVTAFVLHSSGFEIHVPKVDESAVKKAMAVVAARIKNKAPQPGSEAKLRRFIEGFQNGKPNYEEMDAEAALIYRMDLLQKYTDQLQRLGALKSLAFLEVGPRGDDKYAVVGAHGRAEMTIDLTSEGKIDTVLIGKTEIP